MAAVPLGQPSVRCSMELQRAHKRQRSQSPAPLPQQQQPDAATSDPSRIWLPEIVQHFAASLTSNEVACALRLVNKATAAQFSAAQHTTVRLSRPVPPHAFVWRWAGPDAMRTLAQQQRLELPSLTARSGVIANLEVLLARDDLQPVLSVGVMEAAAAAGQLDVCAWQQERGCAYQEGDALTAAAGGGQQAVCEWLLANGCCFKTDVHWGPTAAAARGGHVGLMDWLLLRADSTDVAALLIGAAEGCDLPTLQRLLHTRVDTLPGPLPAGYKPHILSIAAGSPTADWRAKVEWLEAQGYPQTAEACGEAAATPDALPRLQWLRQQGYPLDMGVAACAAEAGNTEALQYVLGQGVVADANLMLWTARQGHVAVMEVLHAGGVPIDAGTVMAAARAGHLPAVAWLVERLGADTALTTNVFEAAAQAGSMELLAWLRARGCPWNATVFATSTEGGSEEQLEWLAEEGCPMGEDGEPYVRAVRRGTLGMLRCLRRLGCPWGPGGSNGCILTRTVGWFADDVCDFGEHGLRMLCWLLDQGCPVDWDEVGAAAREDDQGLMGWLQAQRKQRQQQPAAATSDSSCVWLPEIVQRFAASLTSNEVACVLRLINKAMAAQFSAAQHTTVRLSQPVPHRAFLWRWAGPSAMRTLARQQRVQLPRLTARSGSIANLEVLLARDDLPPVLGVGVLEAAAAAGQLDVCAWLQERGCACQDGDALTAAAGGGQQAVCEWLLANRCLEVVDYSKAAASAAAGGHVGLMDWLLLRADRIDVAAAVLIGAAEGCDLPTLQRLHHTHVDMLPGPLPAGCKPHILSAAAGSPTADWQAKLEWLEAQGCSQTTAACTTAAAKPDALPRLQWLRQRGYPLDMGVAARAAEAGNTEALQYVLGQGVVADDAYMMLRAAQQGGHVAVMELLHAGGVSINDYMTRTAAGAGHLPAVVWLVERLGAGAALTTHVFAAAAQAGSMELLAWLQARGCPWDATVFTASAESGSEEQLEWLAEQGCPMGEDGEPYVRAVRRGTLGMLRCLRRLGCPWGPGGSNSCILTRTVYTVAWVADDSYRFGEHVLRMLSWLLDQGCPVDWDAVEAAAQLGGNEELMGWLQAQRKQRTGRFAASLTSNEVACVLRLINKAMAAQFSAAQHTTVRLSQLVPHHAFVWRWAGPGAMRTLTMQQRVELPRLTARSGSIANLEVLLARDDLPPVLSVDVLEAAAAAGQLDVCAWLQERGCACQEEDALTAAAGGGHVGLMDWSLHQEDIDVVTVLVAAAEGCDLPTLQRLLHTHLDTLLGPCQPAAKPDALRRLQWLQQRNYPLDDDVAARAAEAGNVEALQYVLGQGVVADASMMLWTARQGHVAVMEVLHAGGVPINEYTIRTAAGAGHLPAVAWLVERLGAGAALTTNVFEAAAQAGSMELLAWLRARGCPWNATVFATSTEGGSEEQLEWLAEEGCPMGEDGEPYVRAVRRGTLGMLRCLRLRRVGCPWGPGGSNGCILTRTVGWFADDVCELGEHGLRMLCWLLDQGCPVDWDAVEAAAREDDQGLMGWLQAQRKQRAHDGSAPPPQQQQPATASSDSSCVWLPDVVQRFAALLTSNEVACALRLVNKATAAQFSTPQHTTIRLSQPVPHHAFLRRWAGPGAMRTMTRQQCLELPRLTARSGSIANLEVLLARDDLPPVLSVGVLKAAAASGQLDVCVWLKERGCTCEEVDALTAAAGGGQQAVCEWLCEWLRASGTFTRKGRAEAAGAAARRGNVGLMDRLLRTGKVAGVPSASVLVYGAAAGCDLATLQRLHHIYLDSRGVRLPVWSDSDYDPDWDGHVKEHVLGAAASSTTADWQAKVEWLETRGYRRSAEAPGTAAAKPDALPRLQWLRQRGYPLDMGAGRAAVAGNAEALRYVLGQGVGVSSAILQRAAQGGHVAVMKVLQARGARMGEETVGAAAAAGHLAAVAWLVERLGAGAALTTHVFAAAAKAGSMKLLRWLRAQGCPWDATVFATAAGYGSEEQLEWLVEQGCPMGDDGEPYVRAVCHGTLGMLCCLRRLGCPWGPDGSNSSILTRAVEWFADDGDDDFGEHEQRMLRWLLDQGCPVDWDARENKRQRTSATLPSHAPAAAGPPNIWLPELVQKFAGRLPPSPRPSALGLRLVNKTTAAQFRGPQHATVRLSQPVPHRDIVQRWASPDAMRRRLTHKQCKQLPRLTARSGSIANLEVLLARGDVAMSYDVFEAAAAAGQLAVCAWLRQQGCLWHPQAAIVAAAEGGHQALWLLAKGSPSSRDVAEAAGAAARCGHVGLMDRLLRTDRVAGVPSASVLLCGAAAGCDLPTLQRLHHTYLDSRGAQLPVWSHSGRRETCDGHVKEHVLAAAAGSPTADWAAKVEWLKARGYPPSRDVCSKAAALPDALPRLQWLQQQGYSIASWVASNAACTGNLEVLQYLLGQRGTNDPLPSLRAAAEHGHVEAMEVLHAAGGAPDEIAVRVAAAGGHLSAVAWLVEAMGIAALTAGMELLAWLHEQGCLRDRTAFIIAATYGNMELLRCLHEQGCPWNAATFAAAAAEGSEEQLEWLAERGCPMAANVEHDRDDEESVYQHVEDPYAVAARRGDLARLRCLRRLGCPWGRDGSTMTCAIHSGRVGGSPKWIVGCDEVTVQPVLLWLLGEGCPVDWDAAESAAARKSDDRTLLVWLREQRQLRGPGTAAFGPTLPRTAPRRAAKTRGEAARRQG
ncbi:Ankyrin repeat domain-containing protein [Tetrabaena socialis]|uniref:Ankyrin repeat domain-containing protein n=1 Tax=Tetrabaena socialis TaxID=47790 RepID=A0A2J7ZVD0_9CHLO|nr:Ankyrin repeat domain-containing protein [Tetrabaena socialis]|eukprot:PNH04222.1 Ankyrin repeat domain-containing protein [Tetrabaena socialis]